MLNIIFSKNRPLQLDLALQSIDKNWGGNTVVIYDLSDEYRKAYKQLQKDWQSVRFVDQNLSRIDKIVLDALIEGVSDGQKAVCFFTDDNIVYRPAHQYLYDKIVNCRFACFSLRLGININMRDFGDGILREDSVPQLNKYSEVPQTIFWNRTQIPPGGYWSYPLSVDGHIFNIETMLETIKEICSWDKELRTPNDLESILQRFWFEYPALMLCPVESCVVNSPNNRVQESVKNRSGDHYYVDPRKALKDFNDGKRLSIDSLIPSLPKIVSPHQELNLMESLKEKQ